MVIACIVVASVFVVFILTTFLITRKNAQFEIEGNIIKLKNSGSVFKIFLNENLYSVHHMPQFIKGEEYNVKINDKEVLIKCKCNWFGNKFQVIALIDEKEVYNNSVKI